jgi:hypothetical protein
MHADRANRALLAVVGLLALAIGAGGLLIAYGAFGEQFAHRFLTDNQFARYFSANGNWLWPTLAAVAFVVMLLALIWLLRLLFGSDRASDIVVPTAYPSRRDSHAHRHHHESAPEQPERDHSAGRTTITAGALTQAVASEIETYHGVTSARARVLGEPAAPTLALDVKVNRRADLAALVARIEHEAIAHARAALDRAGLPVKLDISVTDKGAARTQ